MLRLLFAATVVLGLQVVPADARLEQQSAPQVFRGAAQVVSVFATVTDETGHLVPDLQKDAFTVFDNGVPQPISVFANAVVPITVAIMLDVSGSMTGNLQLLRRAAAQFAAELGPDDRAKIGSFGQRIYIMPEFSNKADDLIRFLWEDIEPGGSTPLWGAINAAMTAMSHEQGRRVVLVFTDGYDTAMRPTLAEDIRRAQDEDFMVYAIGLRSSGGSGGGSGGGGSYGGFGRGHGGPGRGGAGRGMSGSDGPDPSLKQLPAETGGGYFELDTADQLTQTFSRVVDELHHQYVIGFTPAALDGLLHKLDLHVTPAELTARARKSYLAK